MLRLCAALVPQTSSRGFVDFNPLRSCELVLWLSSRRNFSRREMSLIRLPLPASHVIGVAGKRWFTSQPMPTVKVEPSFRTEGTGRWRNMVFAPRDPNVAIIEAFDNDPHPYKVNLGVDTYRDDYGNPLVLECVRRAEQRIVGKGSMEYLPMGGDVEFNDLACKLAYGEDADVLREKRVASVQTISGTGACRLMAEYHKILKPKIYMFIPYPTWNTHHNIWKDAQCKSQTYRYYHFEVKELAFESMLRDCRNAEEGSFFLFHACGHNPTGYDPTPEQWKALSEACRMRKHFPFFDMAYQGFASGDFDRDAQAIRIFVADGHQVGVAQSFSKNMGLYGQRVGCLSLVTDNEEQAAAVKSQLEQILRPIYSSPPLHGAEIAKTVMCDPELKALWFKEVKVLADRLTYMRSLLRHNLELLRSEHSWSHITDQVGLFSYTGLNAKQVERMISDHHVFMTDNGRISIAGLNPANVEYVARAIHDVTSREIEVVPPPPKVDSRGRPAPTVPPRRRVKWNGGDWRRS